MSTARYIIGDTRDVTAAMPDGSVDLVLTSPPFLALRSYLPADHPDKHREIGSEPSPAAFLDTLLELTAEWGRVLAPHGSIAVELGDTYSGTSSVGDSRSDETGRVIIRNEEEHQSRRIIRSPVSVPTSGPGWPLAKSKALIPELYRIALAYGINPLTGAESPAGRWRVRNVVTWCRPNPPVGALGDKYRPATSDMVIACRSDKRWFDLDAVRGEVSEWTKHYAENPYPGSDKAVTESGKAGARSGGLAVAGDAAGKTIKAQGTPPLDYWVIPPTGYSGKTSNYRRVPCGPDDGGERTTSADCPVHGDRPAPAPTARHGAHGDQSSDHTPRTDDRPAEVQPDGSEPTDGSLDRSGSSQDPTTDSTAPQCSPAATPRSTASSRTDHAPVTTSPGMPSAGTAASTDDTSGSPALFELHPYTTESSTSPDGSPDLRSHQTAGDSADTDTGSASSLACTCSFTRLIIESTSHYAVYPPELCRIPIDSMCPRQVCRVCGEPRRRVVEQTEEYATARAALRSGDAASRTAWDDNAGRSAGFGSGGGVASKLSNGLISAVPTTLGWTDCGHDAWRNGIVFDPFGGSGTTGMVATGMGRDAVLIDIDERNADLARERIGLFVDIEHHEGTPV